VEPKRLDDLIDVQQGIEMATLKTRDQLPCFDCVRAERLQPIGAFIDRTRFGVCYSDVLPMDWEFLAHTAALLSLRRSDFISQRIERSPFEALHSTTRAPDPQPGRDRTMPFLQGRA
jgi:hypothetical protein|tara:strand:+ start:382 stop:732 length:351 start_codon:yes stop_codon:yes gene_type:complete